MRARTLAATAMAIALLSPSNAAWAGPNGDGICDLRPNDSYCVSHTHSVQRGEWLWKIARNKLAEAGRDTTTSNVRQIAQMIHSDNRSVIGRNSNRLRPGQRLTIRATQDWPV